MWQGRVNAQPYLGDHHGIMDEGAHKVRANYGLGVKAQETEKNEAAIFETETAMASEPEKLSTETEE